MQEHQCRKMFRQIVSAIAYMHSKDYAHRDLKLDNILMDGPEGAVKLIDFGFSDKVEDDQKLSIFCGTPHYMDPDIVRKLPYDGKAADVWACGVILYIVMIGKLPFFGDFEADLFRKIISGKYNIPRDVVIHKSARNLFKKIFQPEVSKRITAEQILQDEWVNMSDTAV